MIQKPYVCSLLCVVVVVQPHLLNLKVIAVAVIFSIVVTGDRTNWVYDYNLGTRKLRKEILGQTKWEEVDLAYKGQHKIFVFIELGTFMSFKMYVLGRIRIGNGHRDLKTQRKYMLEKNVSQYSSFIHSADAFQTSTYIPHTRWGFETHELGFQSWWEECFYQSIYNPCASQQPSTFLI